MQENNFTHRDQNLAGSVQPDTPVPPAQPAQPDTPVPPAQPAQPDTPVPPAHPVYPDHPETAGAKLVSFVMHHRAITLFCLLLTVALAVGVGFWLGSKSATTRLVEAEAQRQRYENQAIFFSDRSRQYYDELINYRSKYQVTQAALDELTEGFNDSQREMADLKEELLFYRQIVVPDKSGKRLRLHEVKLRTTDQSDIFQFRVVLVQTQRRKETLAGRIELLVRGQRDAVPVTLKWSDLQEEIAADTSFNFRYFQRIDGRLKLPAGFVPEQVIVRVRMQSASNRSRPEIETNFPWKSLL